MKIGDRTVMGGRDLTIFTKAHILIFKARGVKQVSYGKCRIRRAS